MHTQGKDSEPTTPKPAPVATMQIVQRHARILRPTALVGRFAIDPEELRQKIHHEVHEGHEEKI
jgi:hypothetical protein